MKLGHSCSLVFNSFQTSLDQTLQFMYLFHNIGNRCINQCAAITKHTSVAILSCSVSQESLKQSQLASLDNWGSLTTFSDLLFQTEEEYCVGNGTEKLEQIHPPISYLSCYNTKCHFGELLEFFQPQFSIIFIGNVNSEFCLYLPSATS